MIEQISIMNGDLPKPFDCFDLASFEVNDDVFTKNIDLEQVGFLWGFGALQKAI